MHFSFSITSVALALHFLSFTSAEKPDTSPTAIFARSDLRPTVQGSCRLSYHTCEAWNHPEACCPDITDCAFDGQGDIACCPKDTICFDSADNAHTVFIHIDNSGAKEREGPVRGVAAIGLAIALGLRIRWS